MKRLVSFLAALLIGARTFSAAPDFAPPVPTILNPGKEGQSLAARLRSITPTENSEFRGTLIIRQRGKQTNTVPVRSAITAGLTNWQVTYQTDRTLNTPAENLTIIHAAGRSNEYLFARASNVSGLAGPPTPLSSRDADTPLAGSNFWLSDLGLEFLHWPVQRLIKIQMTRGRSCRVLESVNPKPNTNGYARVVSWVDVESDGILRAEAYDQATNVLKEFLVGPVKKVNGQWQLQDMKMISPKARSESELRFDLEPKPASPVP